MPTTSALLRSGALTVVLHHDLRTDLRAALTQLLRAHRLLPGARLGAVGPAGGHARTCPPAALTPRAQVAARSSSTDR